MKKIIFQITILTTMISIFSCGRENEKPNQPIIIKNQPQSPSIEKIEVKNTSTEFKLSLDEFKDIPEEIEGCACYFSETNQKFKNDNYLFAANFDSIGFVSVNKKLIKLKLISTGREPDTFGDNDHTDIYKSELYKVIIEIKYKNSNGDETWWNDGTITIENKDGEKVIKKFVGECGC